MSSVVNDALGAVFVHVPKAGGTSVTDALLAAGPPRDAGEAGRFDPSHWVLGEHVPGIAEAVHENDILFGRAVTHVNHARALDLMRALGPQTFRRHYSFAIVRNPFDRIASTYHYIRGRDVNPMSAFCRDIGFEQYVVYNCLFTPHLQTDWICDLNGRVIVSEIFGIEDMKAAGDTIGARLYGAPIRFGTANQSRNTGLDKAESWNAVPPWAVDLFLQTYARDFEVTGHAADVAPFKSADTVSPEAESGAWERLWRHALPQIGKAVRRNAWLARKLHRLGG